MQYQSKLASLFPAEKSPLWRMFQGLWCRMKRASSTICWVQRQTNNSGPKQLNLGLKTLSINPGHAKAPTCNPLSLAVPIHELETQT
jgi:hypothetical protein